MLRINLRWARFLLAAMGGLLFALSAGAVPDLVAPNRIQADPLKRAIVITEKYLDLRDLLDRISRENGLSLMVSRRVRGSVEGVKGKTIEEVLDETVRGRGFEWRLWENCLYVGERSLLEDFWREIRRPMTAKILRGNKLNADFQNIDLPFICRILRKFSGIDIRVADSVSGNMTLRVINMPWERVLFGVVYLNGFRMLESDFSITISP